MKKKEKRFRLEKFDRGLHPSITIYWTSIAVDIRERCSACIAKLTSEMSGSIIDGMIFVEGKPQEDDDLVYTGEILDTMGTPKSAYVKKLRTRRLICRVCKLKFTTRKETQAHIKREHRKLQTGNRFVLQGSRCSRSTTGLRRLQECAMLNRGVGELGWPPVTTETATTAIRFQLHVIRSDKCSFWYTKQGVKNESLFQGVRRLIARQVFIMTGLHNTACSTNFRPFLCLLTPLLQW